MAKHVSGKCEIPGCKEEWEVECEICAKQVCGNHYINIEGMNICVVCRKKYYPETL